MNNQNQSIDHDLQIDFERKINKQIVCYKHVTLYELINVCFIY